MPLFGIFTKREKKSSNGTSSTARYEGSAASAISEQDADSQWESVSQTTHSHYQDDDDGATPAASSSRVRLAFRRKVSDSPAASLKDQKHTSPTRPPRIPNPYLSNSDADIERLRPPRKSSVYTEAHFSSTGSLPSSARTAPDSSEYQSMLGDTSPKKKRVIAPKKSSGLLSWARERTKSKPSDPPPPPLPAESFNLKSFRHVQPDSPSPSPQPTSSQPERPPSALDFDNLPPARPRPRGDSAASDSQRISVAAFREAQARRSATNSPVPSFRPPSSTDTLTLTNRALTPTRSNPNVNQVKAPPTRRSTAPIDSSSSSSSSSEEDESDDDRPLSKKIGAATIQAPVRAAGSAPHRKDEKNQPNGNANLQRPVMPTHSRSASPQMVNAISRPPSSMSVYGESRATVSTSALTTGGKSVASRGRRASDSSSSSESSSGSDSDDAPLASLVPPRRPGSAASRSSSPQRGAPAKPLIDIRTLITDRAGFSSPEPESANREKGKGKEIQEAEDKVGLAKLAALARAEDSRRAMSPTPTISSTKTVLAPQPLAAGNSYAHNFSRPSHRRMSSDLSTWSVPEETDTRSPSRGPESSVTAARGSGPQRSISPASVSSARKRVVVTRVVSPEPEEVDDDDIMPALRFMMPKSPVDEVTPPPAPADDDPDDRRIIPTPIRQRPPPSSFSVMSRPQHRAQQSSTSTITPATIATFTNSTSKSSSISTSSVSTFSIPTTASTSASSVGSSSSSPRLGKKRSSSMLNIPTDFFSQSDTGTSPPSPKSQPATSPRPDPVTNRSATASPAKSQPSATSKSSTSSSITRRPRSRSSATLVSQIPDSPPLAPESRPVIQPPPRSSSRGTLISMIPASNPGLTGGAKPKPFAGMERRESPASSTGDSSSGRIPLTPRDGSELGSRSEWGSGADRLSGGLRPVKDARAKRRSLSMDMDVEYGRGAEGGIARDRETPAESESRRRDRRRSEAKAAIELGNVINGRGPIADSDSEDNDPLSHNMASRMSQMNPMMGMGGPMNFTPPGGAAGWNPWMQQGQPTPPMMPHPNQFAQNSDFLMAHQQAMMIAKQAYQMAVAQHALAAAGDEWERSSNASGFGGSQAFGGGGGSQFGGSTGFAGNVNMNMGMYGMGGGMAGYGGMPNPGWPGASMLVPPGPRSAYGGFGGAQSDFGGNNSSPGSVGPGGWGSRSVYGESFGPSPGDRSSKAFTGNSPGYQQQQQEQQTYFPTPSKSSRERERERQESGNSGKSSTQSQLSSRPGPRPRTLTAPSSTQVPAQHSSRNKKSPPLPPSSWSRFQPGS